MMHCPFFFYSIGAVTINKTMFGVQSIRGFYFSVFDVRRMYVPKAVSVRLGSLLVAVNKGI